MLWLAEVDVAGAWRTHLHPAAHRAMHRAYLRATPCATLTA